MSDGQVKKSNETTDLKKFAVQHDDARKLMLDSVVHASIRADMQAEIVSQTSTETKNELSSLPPRSGGKKK